MLDELWDAASQISMTKIFSLRLSGTEFKPLQEYHIKHRQSLVMEKLVQQYKENGRKMILLTHKAELCTP